jgi:hypothetical protein
MDAIFEHYVPREFQNYVSREFQNYVPREFQKVFLARNEAGVRNPSLTLRELFVPLIVC